MSDTPSRDARRSFSDFIRNATEQEKREVYLIVMERAEARQKATLKEPPTVLSESLHAYFQGERTNPVKAFIAGWDAAWAIACPELER